ncbi:hypothetical protein, partial [Aliarcobacter butzleri]|uniref:hypothetical protein n=1 Tax=Aliarcobacter butzleri TaxID=28197 RepID=UPI003B21B9AD
LCPSCLIKAPTNPISEICGCEQAFPHPVNEIFTSSLKSGYLFSSSTTTFFAYSFDSVFQIYRTLFLYMIVILF